MGELSGFKMKSKKKLIRDEIKLKIPSTKKLIKTGLYIGAVGLGVKMVNDIAKDIN